jgi:hypothetical protein
LTLLCRSISNFRAALILVRENNVLEACILNRCLYEKELWIAALRERGVEFLEEMRSDEAHARRSLAQLTLEISGRHGADVDNEGVMILCGILNDLSRRFPSHVAHRRGGSEDRRAARSLHASRMPLNISQA